MRKKSKLREKAKKIKFFLFDVDGVLTDGSLFYGNNVELKVFNVYDGIGINLLKIAGIKTGLITAHQKIEAVTRRAKEMRIDEVYQGFSDKEKVYQKILKKYNLKDEEVAFIGDDLPDLPLFGRVGLSISVPNGREEVKEKADYITETPGGKGALRESAELILKSRGEWKKTLRRFCEKIKEVGFDPKGINPSG